MSNGWQPLLRTDAASLVAGLATTNPPDLDGMHWDGVPLIPNDQHAKAWLDDTRVMSSDGFMQWVHLAPGLAGRQVGDEPCNMLVAGGGTWATWTPGGGIVRAGQGVAGPGLANAAEPAMNEQGDLAYFWPYASIMRTLRIEGSAADGIGGVWTGAGTDLRFRGYALTWRELSTPNRVWCHRRDTGETKCVSLDQTKAQGGCVPVFVDDMLWILSYQQVDVATDRWRLVLYRWEDV